MQSFSRANYRVSDIEKQRICHVRYVRINGNSEQGNGASMDPRRCVILLRNGASPFTPSQMESMKKSIDGSVETYLSDETLSHSNESGSLIVVQYRALQGGWKKKKLSGNDKLSGLGDTRGNNCTVLIFNYLILLS